MPTLDAADASTASPTVVIGLEVHVQLLTRTKIFCGCSHRFNPDEPNSQTCPVCLGLPGSLPVMNAEAFRLAVKTALALNCQIARFTKWDRKQYFYPDLPKGYQISQYDLPFSSQGHLEVPSDDAPEGTRRVRITRAHLEEDAGKNIHDETGRGADSHTDLNRAGTPLLEIVSEPDLRSPAEAKAYLQELYLLLTYLDVSDCNMQEGSLRCDANINLHYRNGEETIATPIVEIKNLNSFRGVEAALEYEVARQIREYQAHGVRMGDVGGEKQTRGWNADRGTTFAQRGKEEASDYRYFPDPDLVPVTVSDEFLASVQEEIGEPPADRRARYQRELGLSAYDAQVLIDQGADLVDYFEQVVTVCGDAKQAANWMTQDVLRVLNEQRQPISRFPISADVLGTLLKQVVEGKLAVKGAREVFAELLLRAERVEDPSVVSKVIEEKGLALVSDRGELEGVISAVIEQNHSVADDVRGGKVAAAGPLIGQVMRQVKGADPKTVRALILERLGQG